MIKELNELIIDFKEDKMKEMNIYIPILNEIQANRALEIMREYLKVSEISHKNLIEDEKEFSAKRRKIINDLLKPLLEKFLADNITLSEFKSKIDSVNKKNKLLGFNGIKGQMFFNMILNIADDIEECTQEIKNAIIIPDTDIMAKSKINNFTSYIKRIGEDFVETGGSKYKKPKLASIPFFLSYFWHIQNENVWPVYYTNSVNIMEDLNLFQTTEKAGNDYILFKKIILELSEMFTENSEIKFDLYKVEHIFRFKGGKIEYPNDDNETSETDEQDTLPHFKLAERLPDSFVPPVVEILPHIARNNKDLEKIARASGTNLSFAFEKYVDIAFSILGYETKRLGQGKGRCPDGVALNYDDSYAIIWDAKVRNEGYSMGTDDRTIKEYIGVQSRIIKKRQRFRNIYYVIVSSNFKEDFDDSIMTLKMDTDVNEIILMEAEALVEIVNVKLREPIQITLGPDGLQRLFSISGILTKERVHELTI